MAIYVRENVNALRGLSVALLALITFLALNLMPGFYPLWLVSVLALAIALLALASPPSAAFVSVGLVALPVIAMDLLTGLVFLVAGLGIAQYLALGRAAGFIAFALALLGVSLHAEWAFVVIGGYLIGRAHGVVAGVLAALTLEGIGLALGTPSLGTLATGGAAPGLLAEGPAEGAFTLAWLRDAIATADPQRIAAAVRSASDVGLLLVQPTVWALGAVLGGAARDAATRLASVAWAGAGVVVIAAGSLIADLALGGPVTTGVFLSSALVSAPVAMTVIALGEWLFPARPLPKAAPVPADADAADVDDLLRTIAAAEDRLAARHTARAVVLISDMKSFSSIAEAMGSLASAKLVQRHRDLLLPVIAAHKGAGMPTGGDGLVASFSSTADAISAAVAMQSSLLTAAREGEPELAIRVGVAEGEVVLDAGGRPFLGQALNLAARVMDLADGGRIMIAGVPKPADARGASLAEHGEFKLKNIAEPVPVTEVLWRGGMEPQEIRAS